jgi:hypothetical protein
MRTRWPLEFLLVHFCYSFGLEFSRYSFNCTRRIYRCGSTVKSGRFQTWNAPVLLAPRWSKGSRELFNASRLQGAEHRGCRQNELINYHEKKPAINPPRRLQSLSNDQVDCRFGAALSLTATPALSWDGQPLASVGSTSVGLAVAVFLGKSFSLAMVGHSDEKLLEPVPRIVPDKNILWTSSIKYLRLTANRIALALAVLAIEDN